MTKETKLIQSAIADSTINELIRDNPDLHKSIKIELYKSGMTYRKIAKLFANCGVKTSHQSVAVLIQKVGINRSNAPQKHLHVKAKTLQKEEQIIDMRLQGMTYKAIANALGINHISVGRILKANKLNKRLYRI